MDIPIPKEEIRRAIMKKCLKSAGVIIVLVMIFMSIKLYLSPSINISELELSTATLANMEITVSATGKINPLNVQNILCPLSTNIMEVYFEEGDTVAAGQLLMTLNSQSIEASLRRANDELNLINCELERLQLTSTAYLTDLEMQIKAKEKYLLLLKEKMEDEQDSTAELEYATTQIELERLRVKLANETKIRAMAYRSKQLESTIAAHNLEDVERTLNDNIVEAPKSGTITYINNNLDSRINTGDLLAVISDLSHFKIDAEISVANSSKLSIGAKVYAIVNGRKINGQIVSISPQSNGGMVKFSVNLDRDSEKLLCSGMLTELYVVYGINEKATVINNGYYYQGPGEYSMFVKTGGNTLERRNLILGKSNSGLVEVVNGISPGEEVVINDMQKYLNSKKIKISD